MKNKTIYWLFTVLILPAGFLCLMGSQCTQIKPTLGNTSTSWKLEKYGDANNPQPVLLAAKPEILLNLDGNGHFSGNNGCNLLTGEYKSVEKEVWEFSKIVSTQDYCLQTGIVQQAETINQLLKEVKTYTQNGEELKFYTGNKNKLLQYRKK